MTLGVLAQAISREEPRDKALWKLIAYAARYGSTDPHASRRMTVNDLSSFTAALDAIIEEENEKPDS